MKFVAVFAFLLILGLVSAENNEWGNYEAGDRLLKRHIVTKDYKWFQVVTADYTWPSPGKTNESKIKAIRVIDQEPKTSGGYASIVHGGVDSTGVTLRFKSVRNHGFNFMVEIYGAPEPKP